VIGDNGKSAIFDNTKKSALVIVS